MATDDPIMRGRFLVRPRPGDLDVERDRVVAAVRAVIPAEAEVFEVGSTAVPDVIGKQDIDLLVRAPAEAFESTRRALDRAFARNPDQLSTEQYQGYRVASHHDVAIQCTVKGGRHDTFLEFLDALRRSPELVQAYNDLKHQWHGHDMDEYRQAKAVFILETLNNRS